MVIFVQTCEYIKNHTVVMVFNGWVKWVSCIYVCTLKMVHELYLNKAVVIQKAKCSRLQHLLQVSPWPGHGGKGKQGLPDLGLQREDTGAGHTVFTEPSTYLQTEAGQGWAPRCPWVPREDDLPVNVPVETRLAWKMLANVKINKTTEFHRYSINTRKPILLGMAAGTF